MSKKDEEIKSLKQENEKLNKQIKDLENNYNKLKVENERLVGASSANNAEHASNIESKDDEGADQ